MSVEGQGLVFKLSLIPTLERAERPLSLRLGVGWEEVRKGEGGYIHELGKTGGTDG